MQLLNAQKTNYFAFHWPLSYEEKIERPGRSQVCWEVGIEE